MAKSQYGVCLSFAFLELWIMGLPLLLKTIGSVCADICYS
jgi:hypothetical protein